VVSIKPFFRKSIFAVLLGLLTVSIFLPFFSEAPISWFTGFCYILYDSVLLTFVTLKMRAHLKEKTQSKIKQKSELSLCVLISARNEKTVFKRCLDSLFLQSSPPEQVIIIDDGSTDGSFAFLKNQYSLKQLGRLWQSQIYKNLFVLPKKPSGKARSLNEALGFVTSEICVTLDADTFIDVHALREIRFAFDSQKNLQITGGVLEPMCSGSAQATLFRTFQKFEYIRSFLSRQAWMSQDSLVLVSGAFAAYRTEILQKVGGFDPHSFVEDYEITHRIYKYCYENSIPVHVGVVPTAFAVTDCPATLNKFIKQRQRWFGGFLQTIYKYRDLLGSPEYKNFGILMLPVKSVDTLQPLYGLVALYGLAAIFFIEQEIHPFITAALLFKIILDYGYHFYGLYLYNKWQKRSVPLHFWVQSMIVTISEPLLFQPLRHIGALFGWFVFLTNKNEWTAQREKPKPILAHSSNTIEQAS
jgi:cellulose synthase/poly-beta-1,6-N-acetylglucosamine synthase-like glycosyltransferase